MRGSHACGAPDGAGGTARNAKSSGNEICGGPALSAMARSRPTSPRPESSGALSLGAYATRVLVAVAIASIAFLLWRVLDVLILIFAGIVLAVVFRSLAGPLVRYTPLPEGPAVAFVVIALLSCLVLLGWLIGGRFAEELGQLTSTLPAASARAREYLAQYPVGDALLDALGSLTATSGSLQRLTGLMTTTFGALANTILVLFIAVFLAADPRLYRRGILHLIAPHTRERAARAYDAAGAALRRWLLGTGISMLCVGIITGLGLWALGVPLALSLGILAGLLEFVPFIGPIVAAIPAVLVAFTLGPLSALQVAVLYLAIQQLEGNLLVPLLQKWAVSLAPALGISAVVIFGVLFGFLGLLFATPLVVVLTALVQTLYVEEALEAPREAPPSQPR